MQTIKTQAAAFPHEAASLDKQPARRSASRGRWASLLGDMCGYRLRSVKSRGLGQTVYRAHDPEGRRVALKVITGRDEKSRDWAEQLQRESKIAMQIKHPHLAEVFDVMNSGECDLVAMEYVSGQPLSRFIKKKKKISEKRAVKMVLHLADALTACHAAGLVHRNIHPENVLVTSEGKAKLISFGFSSSPGLDDQSSPSTAETKIARYLAPEQLRRSNKADVRSDVYALGALLYTMVSGDAPFACAGRLSLMQNKRANNYRGSAEFAAELSPAVADVIERSLSADPAERPQSMEEFVQLLRGFSDRIGDYQLISKVGRGAMGHVHRARAADGSIVAIKILHDHLVANERILVRFYQEAKLAMEMSHPNLVPAYEVGCDNGKHFIAMEYIAGKDLKETLRTEGRLPESQALRIVYDVAKALDALHGKGLLHRDVKPGNILFDSHGNARLTDLGLAKQEELDYELTQAGHALGTMQYAPPEQFRDAKTVSKTADIYALGVTLYQMVTGASPFQGKSAIDQLIRKSRNDYVPPEKIVPGLSQQTRDLIRAAMHEDSAKRPSSAKAFAKATVGYLRCASDADAQPQPQQDALWKVVFLGDDGNVQRISGTTEQIRQLIRAGQIGADGRAARENETSFRPLANIAELNGSEKKPTPSSRTKPTPASGKSGGLLRRTLRPFLTAANRFAASMVGIIT
ncbi:serine/threonine-protein kinase [Symmachiella dynata]|uniref:serine/threonine-protein kinase n=1 Tax=Symmachiella dynata TaxID=2527995 RepID=UPI0030EC06BC